MTSKPSPEQCTTSTTSLPTTATSQKTKNNSLSIATSPPPQSQPYSHASFPATPQRTASDPFPPPSPSFSKPFIHRVSTEQPKSAGHIGKNVKFGFGRHAEDGDNRRVAGKKEGGQSPKTKHFHETHANVYTECGRHGDDWLFGGWSVGGVVKRVLGRKE